MASVDLVDAEHFAQERAGGELPAVQDGHRLLHGAIGGTGAALHCEPP